MHRFAIKLRQRSTRLIISLTCKYFVKNICSDVRVRFAPSPTGLLHLGGLRTALYNYLFSKSHNGSFILRVEDTDQSRLVEGSVEKLESDLKWVGLIPDEGPSVGGSYGPYYQSQRLHLYKEEVEKLLNNGSAYYCFCSDRRLDLMRKDSLRRREIPKYDNHCRHLTSKEVESKLSAGLDFCIRFKLTPLKEPYKDLLFGEITHNVAEFEGDPVILKHDGYPTYHLANVVDDHYMKISHVLRGVEWQPSTAKHLLLYKAFQWDPPNYAHLPLLLNTDGTKLSKRNNDISVEAFRKNGIYARALINFLTLCGGGFVKDVNTEKITRLKDFDELISTFSLDSLNVHNCQIPFDRLKEFNRVELSERLADGKTLNEIIKYIRSLIEEKFSQSDVSLTTPSDEKLKNILFWSQTRICTVKDLLAPEFSFLWVEPSKESISKCSHTFLDELPILIAEIKEAKEFSSPELSINLGELASKSRLKYSEFMKSMRICLTGLKQGPSVGELFIQLGKETVIERLDRAYCLFKTASTEKNVKL